MSEDGNIFIQPKKLPCFRFHTLALTDMCKTSVQATNHAILYNDLKGLIMIKLTGMGPAVIHEQDIPFIQSAEKELSGLATYYNIALGQGRHYNQGLYGGPLPVMATDYRSLVYAVMVNDKEQTDKRLDGQNYVLLCFLYHEKLERVIYKSRDIIERIFEDYFSCNNELGQLEQDLDEIKKMINIACEKN